MDIKILKLLNEFANEHTALQLDCYSMASTADQLGFPGASYWFLVQAQDEVLHTRKIYNYLIGRDQKLDVKVNQTKNGQEKSLLELIKNYKKYKEDFIQKTYNLIDEAKKVQDYLTTKFLDWFLIDFYEEIEQAKDYIDMINMSNGDLYSFDKRLSKRKEPDTLAVIPAYTEK